MLREKLCSLSCYERSCQFLSAASLMLQSSPILQSGSLGGWRGVEEGKLCNTEENAGGGFFFQTNGIPSVSHTYIAKCLCSFPG